jgi:hypothetical protein
MVRYYFSAFEKTNRSLFGKKRLDATKQGRTDHHGTEVELSRTPWRGQKLIKASILELPV